MYGIAQQLIKHLSQFKPDEPVGALFWYSEDAQLAVKDTLGQDISEELAVKALERVITSHDANIGVTHSSFVEAVETIQQESKAVA